ncbi:MAG: SDR family oxidoreductase [Anaerolineae bacterium]
MKLLVLGGTRFVGRHLVETAQARGHEITLFNRGMTNRELFPEIERLIGDRDGGLDVLRGRTWDAVIDTCGYVPRLVRASAELLAETVGRYVFISTISVYADFTHPGLTEEASLATLADETVEQITDETYGGLKALCEQAAESVLPGRVLVIRPGLIVGPYDPTDRFTYWPWRIAQGGEVLAPGTPANRTQFIDARDLVGWILEMVERQAVGTFNATGPDYPLTLGDLFEACRRVSGSDAVLTWCSQEFLAANEVAPWVDLPLYLPETDEHIGLKTVDVSRALAQGLRFRPLDETIRDTLAWARTRPADHVWRLGLTAEREASLLASWHARAAAP